jgi:hypothetical protein
MTTLTIQIQEAGENGRDMITFRYQGKATFKESAYVDKIRHAVMNIATKEKAATKYEK